MKDKKRLVVLYTRINGVERVQMSPEMEALLSVKEGISGGSASAGYVANREFHEALGLKVGER